MKAHGITLGIIAALAALAMAMPDIEQSLQTDRAAVERVYHEHRTGTKQPFEQAMPAALIEQLVRQDSRKETTLKKIYDVEITPALIEAEVARINATTRAPEILAEIKHALGDDAARFARTMARPIIVERELRRRFDNDDKLHAPQRREAEQVRASLLAKKPVAEMREVTWQLAPRPADENSENRGQKSEISAPPPQTEGVAKSGAYTVEATAQLSQVITTPDHAPPGKGEVYFEDLDSELQNVLRVQLQKPGDVSAVIETSAGFLVFQAQAKTETTLTATSLTIPKRSYDEWLAQQPEP